MGGAGFEPAKAMPPDLQSGPFGRLGIHPLFDPLSVVRGSLLKLSLLDSAKALWVVEQSWRRDSNSQPSVYKTDALPIELRQPPGP